VSPSEEICQAVAADRRALHGVKSNRALATSPHKRSPAGEKANPAARSFDQYQALLTGSSTKESAILIR